MTEPTLQLAKREWNSFQQRPVWIGCLAAGLILGIAGPFGTQDVMGLVPRLFYWVVIAAAGYLIGSVVSAICMAWAGRRSVAQWIAIGLSSVMTSLFVLALVLMLNFAFFTFVPSPIDVLILAGNIFAISAVVSGASVFLGAASTTSKDQSETGTARLLNRLPFEKRGALVSLSAVDHYVEVTTVNGKELLLMRLKDAMEETAPVEGLKIHRSHWIALNQVATAKMSGGKGEVTLRDGRTLPASRSHLPALTDAGLLPR